MIGLIASKPEQFRWPGWTVLSLTAAILLFVACIEAGFFTRQYRPDFDDTSLAPDQEEERRYQRWSGAARETYDLAIVLLFTGLGAVLAPTSQSDSLPRWAAAGLCWVAATAELIWHFSAHRRLRVHKAA
ncbi:hypothetical protein [Kitasatospora sp. NPDC001175]|uniref:hypothetical protein n=1 Tax=Kitasatospora sp. NPDC001175 TaxID=3157103 RepID=UPI003D04D790